jgi:hypothetical protein
MRPLEELAGTEVLRLAGFGHRKSERCLTGYSHDVFRLDTGEVVATITAHEAHDFARAALRAKNLRPE